MTAELLREAAALMRERAEAAGDQSRTDADVTGVWLGSRFHLTISPTVALAVADWLDATAQAHVRVAGRTQSIYDLPGMDESPAVRVARAYLGSAS